VTFGNSFTWGPSVGGFATNAPLTFNGPTALNNNATFTSVVTGTGIITITGATIQVGDGTSFSNQLIIAGGGTLSALGVNFYHTSTFW
jgi:hypothetical protein